MSAEVWAGAAVVAASVGLVVLAWCAFRVWLAVRRLHREVERAGRRLESEHRALSEEIDVMAESRSSGGPGEGVRSS